MADTNMGKFSESSTSVKAPVTNTPDTNGGFMSSAMNFFNKNKTIIIGVIVLLVVGFVAYRYFANEGFTNGSNTKSITGGGRTKKQQQLQQLAEEESEHFDEAEAEVEDFEGDENEGFDEAENEGFDEAEEEQQMNEGFDGAEQEAGDYQEEFADEEYADEE
jgi:ABC-type phosphate transport system substrate-binding protein